MKHKMINLEGPINHLQIGDLDFSLSGTRKVKGLTITGKHTSGTEVAYDIESALTSGQVVITQWANGEAEIHARDLDGNRALLQLNGRLRMGVYRASDYGYPKDDAVLLTLTHAVVKPNAKDERPSKVYSNAGIISRDAHLDLEKLLLENGAIEVGTKHNVVGASGNNRRHLCVVLPEDRIEVLLAAFTATRILPLCYRGLLVAA